MPISTILLPCHTILSPSSFDTLFPTSSCSLSIPNYRFDCLRLTVAVQNTPGYGNMGPNDCWWAWLVMTVQTMVGIFLDAVVIGIMFARISHPKYRGRTIAISDSAVISRRDGVLKFMFRIADFRRTQV